MLYGKIVKQLLRPKLNWLNYALFVFSISLTTLAIDVKNFIVYELKTAIVIIVDSKKKSTKVQQLNEIIQNDVLRVHIYKIYCKNGNSITHPPPVHFS